MFYQGDLQSGISKAVQESKLVACFVTDNGEESQLWEQEFLGDPTVNTLLADQTVILRLGATSQEAAYLAEIYPLPKTPTLVVIKNGELKEYITSGTPKDVFLRRISLLLQPGNPDTPMASATTNITENSAPAAPIAQQPFLSQTARISSSTTQARDDTSSVDPRPRVGANHLDDAARTESKKKEQNAKDDDKHTSETDAGREPSTEANPQGPQKAADMKYALLQKKRQQEARDERARILKRVEDDKIARRTREAKRKADATRSKEESESKATTTTSSSSKRPSTQYSECALQIRLFDGATIRSRFPSGASLKAEIRPWIDENQEGDTPYTFKQVLTPLPNKDISISEEEQSLQSLGLSPSATLILIPVSGHVPAYGGGNATGFLYGAASAGYGLIASIISPITSFLGSFFWGGTTGSAQETTADGPSPATSSSRINVRTLGDQRAGQDDQQFYNGNAVGNELEFPPEQ
ncbi:uncharacterized protein BP5553_06667 [Venustampulla echinocandica]|uniref:UBX domain-containing protein 2 n=1 Tax=Venustampulla echinocandica TaxID=2656787 RepID=A0A370TKK8_9HELO|nr:uncharacterized protein BP5553_06667 [Venustampulla echinocandica]RDL36055.1 hypothetical protein BP5553_06667 [Venustampulla echinocandica]